MARLDKHKPVRVIGTNRRSLTGAVSMSGQQSAEFESSLERDFLMLLDYDPNVVEVAYQPLTIPYFDQHGVERNYTPDAWAKHANYPATLYEIKFRETLLGEWLKHKPKFKAAHQFCRKQGWLFKVITEREIRTGCVLKNIRFIRSYKDRQPDEGIETKLMNDLLALGETTPNILLEAAFWTKDWKLKATAHLWRLVHERRIAIDLFRPITMNSTIRLGVENPCQRPLSYLLRQVR